MVGRADQDRLLTALPGHSSLLLSRTRDT
jgi:hypothetical protein